ncbi:MAG TPA: hypothetical protein IAB55_07460 [Candidatus Merdivicinus faecavium]|nr:hypothetical protein [Candidatus Merdivicinus faecavium]
MRDRLKRRDLPLNLLRAFPKNGGSRFPAGIAEHLRDLLERNPQAFEQQDPLQLHHSLLIIQAVGGSIRADAGQKPRFVVVSQHPRRNAEFPCHLADGFQTHFPVPSFIFYYTD